MWQQPFHGVAAVILTVIGGAPKFTLTTDVSMELEYAGASPTCGRPNRNYRFRSRRRSLRTKANTGETQLRKCSVVSHTKNAEFVLANARIMARSDYCIVLYWVVAVVGWR